MRCARCRRAETVAFGRLTRDGEGKLGAPADWACPRCRGRTSVQFARSGEVVS